MLLASIHTPQGIAIPTWSAGPQRPGSLEVTLQLSDPHPYRRQDGVTGPILRGVGLQQSLEDNSGQGWELAVLKLAAFPWRRRRQRSQGGGLTQAPRKQAVGSESGCAGAVSDGEAGGRWPVRPAKMAAAPAAGATWAIAAAEAAAGPAGVLHGGSGGWP